MEMETVMIIAGAILVAAFVITGMITFGYFSQLTQYLQSHYPQNIEEIMGLKEIPQFWTGKTRKRIWQFIRNNEDYGDAYLAEIKRKTQKCQQITFTMWLSLAFIILCNGCVVVWKIYNKQ